MRRNLLILAAVSAVVVLGMLAEARAIEPSNARFTQCYPWHGGYYNTAWGAPVALVVPPTAESHTGYGWGVGNTRVTRIRHQFHRNWPGPGTNDRRSFRHTPRWPSDTDQFGIYYIRGPW